MIHNINNLFRHKHEWKLDSSFINLETDGIVVNFTCYCGNGYARGHVLPDVTDLLDKNLIEVPAYVFKYPRR